MKKIALILMTLLTFKVCAQQLPLVAVQTDANGVAWTLRNGSIYDFFLLQQSSASFSNAVNAVVVGGGGGGGSVSNIVIQGGTNIRAVLTSGGGIQTNTLSVTGVVANASIALNATNAQLAQVAVTATNALIALNSTNAQLAQIAVTATNAPDGLRSASTNDVRVSLQSATNGVSYASQLLDATNKMQASITAATNGLSGGTGQVVTNGNNAFAVNTTNTYNGQVNLNGGISASNAILYNATYVPSLTNITATTANAGTNFQFIALSNSAATVAFLPTNVPSNLLPFYQTYTELHTSGSVTVSNITGTVDGVLKSWPLGAKGSHTNTLTVFTLDGNNWLF